jgi:hypothetical protein
MLYEADQAFAAAMFNLRMEGKPTSVVELKAKIVCQLGCRGEFYINVAEKQGYCAVCNTLQDIDLLLEVAPFDVSEEWVGYCCPECDEEVMIKNTGGAWYCMRCRIGWEYEGR